MKTRKVLAILIAAVMMLALLPATVFAADTTFTVGGTSPTHATIQAAINDVASAGGTGTWRIDVKADTYDEEISIVQKAGQNIELVGEAGTVITGGITVDGERRYAGTETLLIKDIKFDKSGVTLAASKDQINLNGYAHHVTIEGCTFIGDDSGEYTVGVRAGVSRDQVYDTTIKNCSFKKLHSAVQARSAGLKIEGCTTENMSSGGVNTQNSTGISILNSQISGPKYGVRIGPDVAAGTVTITGSTITGGQGTDGEGAIFLRTTTTATLVISGSDIIGDIVSDTAGNTLSADGVYIGGNIEGFATENIHITNSRDGSTEVTANADVTYTVIIPSSVDFGTIYKNSGTKTKNFPITVQDALLQDGGRITVAKTSTVDTMTDVSHNHTLDFTFTPADGGFVFTGDGTKTGTISCQPSLLTAAGSYKGYMTFSVTYGALT